VSFYQFIKERKYLSNVSPATIEWYEQSLHWLDTESPSEAQLKDFVMRMREKGLKATGCNCRIRAVNAYLKWSGSPHRVPRLKEPQHILPTFSTPQVIRLIESKPRGFYPRRLHLIVLVLDMGCRISEALGMRLQDCDFDNLLLTVIGKGSKERKIPMSFELRKALVRYVADFCPHHHMLVFSTRRGGKLGRRVVLRDVKMLCKRLGFNPLVRMLFVSRKYCARGLGSSA
jgi:site-specific recombinase XerD